jgi:hypothetical protein
MPVEAAVPETSAAPSGSSAPESGSSSSFASSPSGGPESGPGGTAGQPAESEQSPFAGQSIEDAIFKTLEEKRLAREEAAEEQHEAADLEPGVEPEVEDQKTQQAAQEETFDLNEPEINAKWLDDLAKAEKVKFADDATRDQFFKTVREHGEFKKVAELFPDVESAQEAQADAAAWMTADHIFSEAHTPEGTVNFIRYLMDREQETPILSNGQSVVRNMFDNMRAWDLEHYEKQFKSKGDEEGLAALEVLRERIGPSAFTSGQALAQAGGENLRAGSVAGEQQMSPQLAQRLAAVQAREQALSKRESEQQTHVDAQFRQSIREDIDWEFDKLIEPALNAGAFSDAIRDACQEKIYDRVMEVLDGNQLHRAQSEALLRKGASPENRQAIVALKMKYLNTVAPQIIRQTIREFSSPVVRAQAERDARQKEQEQRSRSEPKGVASPATTPQALNSPAQFVTKAIADLTKENGGRRPSQDQIIERVVLLKQQLRQQAR